jgi:hypothetical protein
MGTRGTHLCQLDGHTCHDSCVWLGEAESHGSATLVNTYERCRERGQEQVAQASSSPPCEALGLLLVGGKATTGEIKAVVLLGFRGGGTEAR